MRLLHTTKLRFEEFYADIPRYAILSHRWGKDEVTYQEFLVLTAGNDLFGTSGTLPLKTELERKRKGDGFFKIHNACKTAADRGHCWIWIDTCCIDKSSSAELSEAINSMFAWYSKAEECYAYLVDVECQPSVAPTEFQDSKWFQRGWTLQELLAPREVVFFDVHWQNNGSKRHELTGLIARITGITPKCLMQPMELFHECIATKMRWAANRHTTRLEDRAYSLLGLFNVHMPLLYGEGMAAFRRLQKAIMAQSDDSTILAHTHRSTPLATDPNEFVLPFRVCDGTTWELRNTQLRSCSISVTSKGIKMRAAFVQKRNTEAVIALNCINGETGLPYFLPVRERGELRSDFWTVVTNFYNDPSMCDFGLHAPM